MCSLRDWPDWVALIAFISSIVFLILITIVVERITETTYVEERCETRTISGARMEHTCVTITKPIEARK